MNIKNYPILEIGFIVLVLITLVAFGLSYHTENTTEEYYKKIIDNTGNSYEGYNLFANRITKNVYLMNNSGDIKHNWDIDENIKNVPRRFNYPLILEGGDLLYINYQESIARINPDSEVEWVNNNLGHHDADIYKGNILTFHREDIYSEKLNRYIQDDIIKQVNPKNGKIVGKNVSLYDVLLKSEIDTENKYKKELLQGREITNNTIKSGQYQSRKQNNSLKLFHANSINVLRKDYGGVFKKGRIILSLRNINLVILMDWEEEKIVWNSKIDLDRQHHPTMTEEGNILIYDNGWEERDYTRLVEVSPDNEIVWEYKANPPEKFYSKFMGSVQELPNNNILTVSSTQERAFEINKTTKEIVWEFNIEKRLLGPTARGHGGIFRLTRFNKSCVNKIFNKELKHSRLCN